MNSDTDQVFRFSRELPAEPFWAIEASAGTGKTWTIENLVAAYLADGTVSPEEVVIVTFTRAAASELRSRIRSNLAKIVREEQAANTDISYSAEEKQTLQRVLAAYGQIRISTIHGFAQRSLSFLGDPLSNLSPNADSESVVRSVLRDTIRSWGPERQAKFVAFEKVEEKALGILKKAVQLPSAVLTASVPTEDTDFLIELVEEARLRLHERKAKLDALGYTDLLVRLNERLNNSLDAETLARSFRVLLIDEFQDTDAVQWEIFQKIAKCGYLKAFVVVGDPKQSIYGFRGGDVQVYREAVRNGSAKYLEGNRRSSKAFVDAANTFFSKDGNEFGFHFKGESGAMPLAGDWECQPVVIPYIPVKAAGDLRNVDSGPAWLFRELKFDKGATAEQTAVSDLPGYIAGLVATGTIPDPETGKERPVRFSDICVLANSNALIAKYVKALQRKNIPTSVLGGGNIFSSEAATQWRFLLEAVASPSRVSSARLFAWTWFGGKTLPEIAENRDTDEWLAGLQSKLFAWHEKFATKKRTEFFDFVITDSEVLLYLSTRTGGARNVTDILHIAEILRLRPMDSLAQLSQFLAETSESKDDENESTDVAGGSWTRRIDGDVSAVRLMTIHQSKGLEFPIVLLPYFGASRAPQDSSYSYRVHRDGVVQTVLDITTTGSDSPGATVKKEIGKAEHERKAYVALTRGKVRNVLWTWSQGGSSPVFRDHAWRKGQADEEGLFAWDKTDRGAYRPPADPRPIALSAIERELGAPPQRLSYSSLEKHVLHRGPQVSEPDYEPDEVDEPRQALRRSAEDIVDPLSGSALLGLTIHHVLQTVVLGKEDRRQTIGEALVKSAKKFGLRLDEEITSRRSAPSELVINLLETALSSDLGELSPGTTLADYGDDRRLAELNFDFTLREGVTLSKLVDLLRRHLSNDPAFCRWLERLEVKELELTGYFTGQIDAVLAIGVQDAVRFAVVDYKSNRLPQGPEGYGQEVMSGATIEHNYQLQALVYLVALHRYLRSRLGEDYTYDTHIAGAAYLFLRGMRPDVPGAGVFMMQPSSECIEELSLLFDGGVR